MDKNILHAIKNGEDDKVLKSLYDDELPKVKRYVLRCGGTDEEAYDIFQDALLVFYKQVIANKFDEKYEIGAFIYTISRNLWINYVKKKNRMLVVDDFVNTNLEIQVDTILENIVDAEKQKAVQHVFAKMQNRCMELLTYSIFQDLTMEDIAFRMNFASVDAAKTANYRCKQQLMKLIKEHLSLVK